MKSSSKKNSFSFSYRFCNGFPRSWPVALEALPFPPVAGNWLYRPVLSGLLRSSRSEKTAAADSWPPCSLVGTCWKCDWQGAGTRDPLDTNSKVALFQQDILRELCCQDSIWEKAVCKQPKLSMSTEKGRGSFLHPLSHSLNQPTLTYTTNNPDFRISSWTFK